MNYSGLAMAKAFVPLKKLRRNGKYLLFGALLLAGAAAVYHEMVVANAWSSAEGMIPNSESSSWRGVMFDERLKGGRQLDTAEDSAVWRSSYIPQAWKPEYMGQANLHVFEDWCGSSIATLHKNLHYPLYPHVRTTVQKLAVTPQWTNYGLRIFGYLHPYADGEFVFALSSDDNSEFWLSTDDSPLNVHLLAWVGMTGSEWTAPGEFEKYASQTSRPVRLSAQMRYFFEVIHKQNDRGTDHVEVAWKVQDEDFRFMVIESKHISLYVNESAKLMSDVAHIPQTAASHKHTPTKKHSVAADMLRGDPRDTFYKVPMTNSKYLQGVLPDCSYKPSYKIKDFPLHRYQGLQFVHLSYIYPNDYTRLTHMEQESSCFYPKSYRMMYRFSSYMRLDPPDGKERENRNQRKRFVMEEDDRFGFEEYPSEEEAKMDQNNDALYSDYGDDYDDYVLKRRRKLFSLVIQKTNNTLKKHHKRSIKDNILKQKPAEPLQPVSTQASRNPLHQQQNQGEVKTESSVKNVRQGKLRSAKRRKRKSAVKPGETNHVILVERNNPVKKDEAGPSPEQLGYNPHHIQRSHKMSKTQIQNPKGSQLQSFDKDALKPEPAAVKQQPLKNREKELQSAVTKGDVNSPLARLNLTDTDARKKIRVKEIEMNMPLQQEAEYSNHRAEMIPKGKINNNWENMKDTKNRVGMEDKVYNRAKGEKAATDFFWGLGDYEGADTPTPAPVFDTVVNWNQTFRVNHMDLQAMRSDWIDLHCNISGNLLLHSSDVMPIVNEFMDKLNEKHQGQFTLVRVINVEKRVDSVQGSRYLLELELNDANGQPLRLSHYIYGLIQHNMSRRKDLRAQQRRPRLVLCNPVGFRWNPLATVHFIVPVKNQARWVQQLILDMEDMFRVTGDDNFNLIITDYNSTDMDVRKALEKSSLPRYQYVKLSGNFERSAGLQAGIDLIDDDHSIVFLCDLHIQFPPSIIDSVRKHCVEGYMAFAPILMRLDCGATKSEARGYWEVNGFGLLGIYKSDLDAVGGMNTKEFKDRWGGEDWELLDRILQGGLEVERLYIRNFFHHYHSKRGMWNRRTLPRLQS